MLRRRRETKKLLKVARMLQAIDDVSPRPAPQLRRSRVGVSRASA
ncbi:MAG TPA: hypothetical protein VFK17_00390 [Gaiellaceae bacterium]|jgi:hypothetical protein|nr:hypothetical protein [Gaiellaceae bacterium]